MAETGALSQAQNSVDMCTPGTCEQDPWAGPVGTCEDPDSFSSAWTPAVRLPRLGAEHT